MHAQFDILTNLLFLGANILPVQCIERMYISHIANVSELFEYESPFATLPPIRSMV
jgi:hypothetical protein